jgi:hypothetical protein
VYKPREELNFVKYSDSKSKRYNSEADVVEYKKDSTKLQYDLILGTETMKE